MKKFYVFCASLLLPLSAYADTSTLVYDFEYESRERTYPTKLYVSETGATLDEATHLDEDDINRSSYISRFKWSNKSEKSIEYVNEEGDIVSERRAKELSFEGIEKCIMVKDSKTRSIIIMNVIEKNYHLFCPSRIIMKTYGFDNSNLIPSEAVTKVKTFHMNSGIPMEIYEFRALQKVLDSAESDRVSINPSCWTLPDPCTDEILKDGTNELREEYHRRYGTQIIPDKTTGFSWNRQ